MKVSLRSRRMFLQGVGGASLAIPFLPSLAPGAAVAAGAGGPTRLAFIYTKYGNHYKSWWTNNAPTMPSQDGSYQWRTLSDIDGELSPILAPFNGAIRRKIAVVRGLDPYCKPSAHNSSFATTANVGWGTDGPNAYTLREPHFAYSIDAVLEESSRFYPTRPALGALRTAGNTRFSYGMESWSWTHKTGVIQRLPHDWNPKVVYDKVFKGANPTTDPKAAARLVRLKDATTLVNEDFKRALSNRRISSQDKIRLDNFMSLLSQVRSKLDAPVVSCSRGAEAEALLGQLDDFNKINTALLDMEVAALACGTTKIVTHGLASYGPSLPEESDLKWHEICHANDARALTKSKWHGEKVAELIKKLDAVTEGDGNTLLDNTLVIYANEDCTGGHFLMDMPLLLAGGKGKIKTDLYIDYRNLNDPVKTTQFGDSSGAWRSFFFGRPYNNLLITALKALGLTEADYKKYPDQDGYGGYTGGHGATHYTKFVSTPSERNAPLPGLWLGG